MKKGIIYTVGALLVAVVVTIFANSTQETATTSQATITTGTTSVVDTVTSSTISSPSQPESSVKTEVLSVTKLNASDSDVVFFNTPVSDDAVTAAIELLEQTGSGTTYLRIDSPGGSVVAGARLLDYLKHSGKNIVTVCDNMCASMAFQIFQMGSKRLMTEKAILMAHPASGGSSGTIENMTAVIKMFKLYVDRMDADVAKRAGIPYKEFKHMVADNIWAETPEALKLNLADGVVYLNVRGSMLGQQGNVFNVLKKRGQNTPANMNIKGYHISL